MLHYKIAEIAWIITTAALYALYITPTTHTVTILWRLPWCSVKRVRLSFITGPSLVQTLLHTLPGTVMDTTTADTHHNRVVPYCHSCNHIIFPIIFFWLNE
uniref:Uncharacterized protein n=1 Tax=Lygus hesperus TaxID=30085 RepID=A0A0A9W8C2_LYGHE